METGTESSQTIAALPKAENETIFAILIAASVSHLLNDTIQSLIPAIYPVLKDSFQLNFTQIGLITLTFQITASMLQPIVGLYTDHRPQPFSLAIGMGFSLVGLILLSVAGSYWMILCASALVGLGSSVFHPEASALRGWPLAADTVSLSPCFKSAEMPGNRWDRFWLLSSWAHGVRTGLPGSRRLLFLPSSFCSTPGVGIKATFSV